MSCDSELKYLLGDFLNKTLPEPEMALVQEHLKSCPDCQEDLVQIERLVPLLINFSENHVPAEALVNYHHGGEDEHGFNTWARNAIEQHLAICEQCREELDKLIAIEKEFETLLQNRISGPQGEKQARSFRKILPTRKLWYAVAAAAAILLVALPTFLIQSKGPMLAVLPFKYSGPYEKEFFSEALSNEITADLEKINALAVTSPASSSQYGNSNKKTRQIGQELGVDYLLIGLIQWDTTVNIGKLRVLPSLIRVKDDAKVWSEDFEIIWGEVCNLPGVVTRKVIAALNVQFLEAEQKAIETCPTGEIVAYENYLRGNIFFKNLLDLHTMQAAIQMYSRAVELDSSFALAYTMLSRTATEIYWHHLQGEKKYLTLAKASLDKAFELQPKLPEAHLALGSYFYHNLENDSALTQFRIAELSLPNNSDLQEEMGNALLRKGHWQQGIKALENAFKLDPRDAFLAYDIGQAHHKMRNYPDAEKYYKLALSLYPEPKPSFSFIHTNLANLYIEWFGQFDKATQQMKKILGEVGAKFFYYGYEGWFEKELSQWTLANAKAKGDSLQYYYQKGLIFCQMKEPILTHAYFDSARPLIEYFVRKRPESGDLRSQLGIVYAGLGRKEEAIREAKKATEIVPMSKDAANFGPTYILHLARTYVMIGEYDRALDQIEYLLSMPSDMSINRLRLHLDWAPLRNHPRFKKIVENIS